MMKRVALVIVIVLMLVLILSIIFYNDQQEVVYDIVGTYTGEFCDVFVYYVFEPSGQYYIYISKVPASTILDEGTYEAQGNGIFSLASARNLDHMVVCGDGILYDFDAENADVYFAKKTSKEIFYINLHENRVASATCALTDNR